MLLPDRLLPLLLFVGSFFALFCSFFSFFYLKDRLREGSKDHSCLNALFLGLWSSLASLACNISKLARMFKEKLIFLLFFFFLFVDLVKNCPML